MENKYLNEEKYQKTNNKVKKIGLSLLLIGVLIGGSLISIGVYNLGPAKKSLQGKVEIEKTKLETFTFRDETFTCERRYYLWEETGFECTDSEQDDEVFWKVVELYRLKHPDATDLPVKE